MFNGILLYQCSNSRQLCSWNHTNLYRYVTNIVASIYNQFRANMRAIYCVSLFCIDSDKVHSDAKSQEFYCTLTSVVHAKADSHLENNYAKCGPPQGRMRMQELTRTGEIEPLPYETPQSLFKSK